MNEFTYDFLGKKPSRPQLLKKAIEGAKRASTLSSFTGERMLLPSLNEIINGSALHG